MAAGESSARLRAGSPFDVFRKPALERERQRDKAISIVGVQDGLEALPGVTAVGQIDAPPTVDWHLRSNYDADWLPRTVGQPAINAEIRSIGGNYAGAMRIPLLAGRAFDSADME